VTRAKQKVGLSEEKIRDKMWGASSVRRDHRLLATFFNIQISGLADRFVMEIAENVNPGTEKRQFSKIALENRKNMRSQIVVCHSRELESGTETLDLKIL
jgi:hypothetical protein